MLTSASQSMIATNATFMFLAGIAVVMRIYIRKKAPEPLAADDYLIIASWVCMLLYGLGGLRLINLFSIAILCSFSSHQYHGSAPWRVWRSV